MNRWFQEKKKDGREGDYQEDELEEEKIEPEMRELIEDEFHKGDIKFEFSEENMRSITSIATR